MTTTELLKISLRQNAIFIPTGLINSEVCNITESTVHFVANISKLGFGLSEPLLQTINTLNPTYKLKILKVLQEVLGINKNWTPLVKGWDVPTGERKLDHILTLFANTFKTKTGTTLPCGHLIPLNTFPLERYNGCPFCGTPFEFGTIENYGKGNKLKVLEWWAEEQLLSFMNNLLTSKTALDATQTESLKVLIQYFPLPKVQIEIKETLMIVIDTLIENNKETNASKYLTNPTDILRYLWYKKTGLLQIVKPNTIIKRIENNNRHVFFPSDNSAKSKLITKLDLKLKYSRKECLMIATWLNNLEGTSEKNCEIMHPNRSMWIRFIRALRLPEYAKKNGFERLALLLDVFYNQKYEVWQGRVNYFRLKSDAENTFKLLKQRPGLFARSLFSNMLWFGQDCTLQAFSEVIDKIPARLVFSLNMYAKNYFILNGMRNVKALGGVNKRISSNALLKLYDELQLKEMQDKVEDLCLLIMKKRFLAQNNSNKTIYIDPQLFNIPLSIGDRSDTVQDLSSALMGTKFPVEGNEIRLFMQWGMGLPAQHLDMDLSCYIAYENKKEFCSFSNLVATGCKHSGDIRHIPNKIGTAEYINLNILELQKAGAKYVTFTCNAYSNGGISPNLVVGWMNSNYPMRISEKTGVAYEPSSVQHQVRVTKDVTKGLVFGVLDVSNAEIIWLEMSFEGQLIQGLDNKGVVVMLEKLNSKINIGQLLTLKAEAQGLQITERELADEVYDIDWARNTAKVTQLLIN